MGTNLSTDLILVLRNLRKLSPNEQIDTILKHAQSLAIVRALPAEELLLTIKQVGLEDSLGLIELLSPEQLQVMFDLDVWQNDVIDNDMLSQWIGALESASPESALEQMREADIELLTLMLRRCADIYDLIENDDPIFEAEMVLYTTDRHYVLAFKTDEEHIVQSRFLRAFLEDLMGRDFLFAIRVIESARWETESLLHDDALRLRDGRLQDLGFLPMAEARSILTFVDVDRMKKVNFIPEVRSEGHTALRWHYNIPSLASLPFLREALLGLSHTTLDESWGYIATVVNRVHMAQFGRYSDADAVAETARYTLNHLEMAIAYLSQGDLSQAKGIFLSHPPQDLFKIGHSLVLRLQRDFQKVRQHPSFVLAGTSLARLDTPLREVARGVLHLEPMFFAGLSDPKRIDYRHFENLRDVAQVSAAISEVAFRCALLGPKGLGFSEPKVGNQETSPAPFGVLVATYFGNLIVGGKGSFEPLSKKEFQKFFESLEKSDTGRRITAEHKNTCVELLQETALSLTGLVGIRTAEDARHRASTYAHIIFGFIESELGKITDEKPDSKFVTSLLVKEA